MSRTVERQAVDLWRYLDLVVIYLGMRVESPRGLLTLLSFGRKIHKAVKQRPEGLLLHEDLIYARRFLGIIPAILPIHMGMRQYWTNFDALEHWSRSGTHAEWWRRMAKNTRRKVAHAMNGAALAVGSGPELLDRRHQARRPVGDDEQRAGEPARGQIPPE